MKVRVWIPGPLKTLTSGYDRVDLEIAGGALGDALEGLFMAHPGLRDRVLTERGEIREHLNVFVGNREARSTGGLATPLTDGLEITILPAISGGCIESLHRDTGENIRKTKE